MDYTIEFETIKKELNQKYDSIDDGTNRIVFLDEDSGKVYKLAKNLLGLTSNREEIKLSKKDSSFVKTSSLNGDILISSDYIDIDETSLVTNILGIPSYKLSSLIDYEYFLYNKRYEKRDVELEPIEKNYNSVLDEYPEVIHNDYYNLLLNTVNKYSLEPSDIIGSAHVINGEIKIYDFGLTESNYFDNMGMLIMNNGFDIVTTCLIKSFNGELIPSSGLFPIIKKPLSNYIDEHFENNDIDVYNKENYDNNNRLTIKKDE